MTTNLFGWSEATWLFIDQIGILLGVAMGATWFFGILWAVFKPDTLRRWFTLNRFPNVGAELDDEQYRDAIAFTVSHKELPLWVIRSSRPAHIGLIATADSKQAALEIAQQAEKQGIRVHGPVYVENPDDPAEALAQTRLILSRLREAGARHIAVDITGGKTPMSLGAFMAAEEMGVSSLYVASRYDATLRKPDMSSAKIRCISRPE